MVNEMRMLADSRTADRGEGGREPGREGCIAMIRIYAAALVALLATMAAGTASGADADAAPEIKMPEVNVKTAQGWYVRGDAGYAVGTDHHAPSIRAYDSTSGDYGSQSFDNSRFDGSDLTGGIGIGYQFNDLIRADVTGDLFDGDFDGRFADDSPCSGGAAGTGCRGKSSSSFRAGSLMVNGYVDLGTVAGFTPYLGAGIGATRVNWDSVDTVSACVDGAVGCGGAANIGTRYPGESSWRMTYALMAGVSYDIAPNMKVDLGYRYSHVAGGDMFGYSAADSAAGAEGSMGHDGGLARHEIRVGLRITTW
jgi:opacity protein-like surface antigen